jgi:hypothetical protein
VRYVRWSGDDEAAALEGLANGTPLRKKTKTTGGTGTAPAGGGESPVTGLHALLSHSGEADDVEYVVAGGGRSGMSSPTPSVSNGSTKGSARGTGAGAGPGAGPPGSASRKRKAPGGDGAAVPASTTKRQQQAQLQRQRQQQQQQQMLLHDQAAEAEGIDLLHRLASSSGNLEEMAGFGAAETGPSAESVGTVAGSSRKLSSGAATTAAAIAVAAKGKRTRGIRKDAAPVSSDYYMGSDFMEDGAARDGQTPVVASNIIRAHEECAAIISDMKAIYEANTPGWSKAKRNFRKSKGGLDESDHLYVGGESSINNSSYDTNVNMNFNMAQAAPNASVLNAQGSSLAVAAFGTPSTTGGAMSGGLNDICMALWSAAPLQRPSSLSLMLNGNSSSGASAVTTTTAAATTTTSDSSSSSADAAGVLGELSTRGYIASATATANMATQNARRDPSQSAPHPSIMISSKFKKQKQAPLPLNKTLVADVATYMNHGMAGHKLLETDEVEELDDADADGTLNSSTSTAGAGGEGGASLRSDSTISATDEVEEDISGCSSRVSSVPPVC